MKNINSSNRAKNKFSKMAPRVLFYIFVIIFLLLGVAAIISLFIMLFCDCYSAERVDILVGLASALLSAGILTNALASFIRNTFHDASVQASSLKQNVTLLVDDFNKNVIEDVNFVIKVLKETKITLNNSAFEFKPILDLQTDAIKKFETPIQNKDSYLKELILSSARYLILGGNVSNNKDMHDYCMQFFNKNTTFALNTYGVQEVLNVFRQKRIKIFNFFEKLSIQYFNNIVDRELLISQFGKIINDLVKLCYYDIYINEGNSSYPGLQLLCSQLQQENKGAQK